MNWFPSHNKNLHWTNLNQSICCVFPEYNSPCENCLTDSGLILTSQDTQKEMKITEKTTMEKQDLPWLELSDSKVYLSHIKKGSLVHSLPVTNNSSTWAGREWRGKKKQIETLIWTIFILVPLQIMWRRYKNILLPDSYDFRNPGPFCPCPWQWALLSVTLSGPTEAIWNTQMNHQENVSSWWWVWFSPKLFIFL